MTAADNPAYARTKGSHLEMDRDYANTEMNVPEKAPYRRSDHEIVDHNMTNHAPAHPGVVDTFESLRRAAKLFAHQIVDVCPDSRERSLALTNAEQALMWAVASIAREQ